MRAVMVKVSSLEASDAAYSMCTNFQRSEVNR
jgi:hypothetical protein